jgi:tetratricopeptide (TPR) repeat protein
MTIGKRYCAFSSVNAHNRLAPPGETADAFARSGKPAGRLVRSFLFSVLPLVCMAGTTSDPSPWTALFEAGTASYQSSNSAEAVTQLEAALANATSHGATELEKTKILDSLGAAYEALGRLADAQAAFDSALATRTKLLPAPNESLAISLTNESTIYWAMANADKAVEFAERAKKMWEDLNQQNRREYAIVVNDLLAAYRLQGKIASSVPLMYFAKDLYPRILPASDPTLAQSLSALASSFKEAGNYSMAEALSKQTLQIAEANPKTPPSVRLHLLSALADLEMAEGHLGEAKKVIDESLAISIPGTNVSVLQLANEHRTLGTIYRLSGDPDHATEQYEMALKILEHSSGQAAVQRGTIYNDMALVAEGRQDWKSAEHLFDQALSTMQAAFGTRHPALASTYSNLAGVYEHRHQLSKAEDYYRQALSLDSAALPHLHPVIARDLNNLGTLEFKFHQYEKAEPLFRQSIEVFEQTLGPNHPSTGLAEANLANSLASLKRNSEARAYFSKAAAVLEKSWGVDDPRLTDVLRSYAAFSWSNADIAEAEEIETHLVRIRVKQAIAQERGKTSS